MILARVSGSVRASVKDAPLEGEKLLLATPVGLDGTDLGRPLVVVDRIGAGVGDLVLVLREGGSARALLGDDESPVQALVVAIVDDVSIAEDAT